MSNQQHGGGNGSNHPCVVTATFIAALIAIIVFVTGQVTLPGLISKLQEGPSFIATITAPPPPTDTPIPPSPTDTPIPPSPTDIPIPPSPTDIPPLPGPDARATISNVSVEHNIVEGNQKGMIIHAKVTVSNLKNVPCRLIAYFYYQSGEPVKDSNGVYAATDGQVSDSRAILSSYDEGVIEDLPIFMPYTELIDTNALGNFNLKFTLQLHVQATGASLASADGPSFILQRK